VFFMDRLYIVDVNVSYIDCDTASISKLLVVLLSITDRRDWLQVIVIFALPG